MMKNTYSALIAISLLLVCSDALAYIDPGSGSILLQLLIATVIGLFFKFRAFISILWSRIKTLWKF